MKNQVLIISILFFGSGIIANHSSAEVESDYIYYTDFCPPYYEESGRTLVTFLTSDRFKGNRQESGIRIIEEVNPKDVVLSDDSGYESVCKKLREHFPWPREHYFTSYFKLNGHYYVVNAVNVTQPEEEGKINIHTGSSTIIVLDNELNRIGHYLY
jgi:hypothetical protein